MSFRTLKDDMMKYFQHRSKFAAIVVAVLFSLLFLRLIYLQIYKYDYFMRLSENNRIREMNISAERGFIKDRHGVILVRNAPGYELEMVKEDVVDVDLLLDNVSKIIPVDKQRVMKRIKQAYFYEPVRVTRGLNFEQLSYFMEHSADYQGLQFVVVPTRNYIDKYSLTHVLGYLGEVNEWEVTDESEYVSGDIIGRTGIEKQYDVTLRGIKGFRRVEVDSYGRVVEILSEIPSVPGKHILLTIDYELQKYITSLMDGKKGAVVVLDGTDSSLLAMVSAPTYDLSMFSPFIKESDWSRLLNDKKIPLLNRSIEGAYPPGSVLKILVSTVGLMEGYVDKDSSFHCGGSYKTSPRSKITYNCWKKTGHGEVDLKKSLRESCDVYYYNLGTMIGIDKLSDYAKRFSLGKLTGVNLPNEKSGIFPSREWKLSSQAKDNKVWLPGDTVNSSIGQGYVTTTPLQVAVMASSIFNGGTVYVPRIVEAIEDPITGDIVREPVVISDKVFIPEDVRRHVMNGIVSAVEDRGGTSGRGRIRGLRYGGKTGTAQVVSMRAVENMKDDDIPEHWRDHSWYVGVYPADKPKYTVVVMVENGGSGGKSSATVASQVINKMLELGYVSKD